MNFPTSVGHPCQKSRAAKVNEFYTNPSPQVIFSAFLANYGRNSNNRAARLFTHVPFLQQPAPFSKMLSLNKKWRI
ncbi:hypothetical protein A3860_38345 [Niastella vici]|uniref:Uncharacterized protein n=1 Tax=Niastella vici TaxID=1703345 RepID=A0A1V9FLD8_9BACT|nr:hypothetical protein [Niastella vici]OQP59174.1 hypothetical protein A3860_38345 [Niastella vici]